jgi:hypothetical protein
MGEWVTDRTTLKTRVFEGVTIVLSILAAFALDSWWDNHVASRALHEGLTAVVEELKRSEQHVAQRVVAYDRVDGYLTAVLHLLGTEGNGSVIEIPDTLLAAVLYTPTIDPPTGALDAFLRSGLLASIANPELRDRLAALPSRYGDGSDDERDALEYTLASVRPLLERSLSAQDFLSVLRQMDHYWDLFRPSSSWATPVYSVRLRATPQAHNAIASRLQMLRIARGEVEGLRKAVSDAAVILHQALE